MHIWFPYSSNAIIYWIGYFTCVIPLFYAGFIGMCANVIWYLLLNCSIKYQSLGSCLRNAGAKQNWTENSVKKTSFREDVVNGMNNYIDIHKYDIKFYF